MAGRTRQSLGLARHGNNVDAVGHPAKGTVAVDLMHCHRKPVIHNCVHPDHNHITKVYFNILRLSSIILVKKITINVDNKVFIQPSIKFSVIKLVIKTSIANKAVRSTRFFVIIPYLQSTLEKPFIS